MIRGLLWLFMNESYGKEIIDKNCFGFPNCEYA